MNRVKRQRGFSLIELVVVVFIILLISAMAAPRVTAAISNIQLRGAMNSLSGMLQRTRIIAVKTNRIIEARLGQTGGANVAYVDLDTDGSLRTTNNGRCPDSMANNCAEPLVQAANTITVDFTGPATALDATILGFTPTSPNPFNVAFNQRGVPCTPNPATSPTACASNVGFRYYFRMTDTFGTRWAAITVTPAGRIRVWTLTGTTWN